MIRLTSGTCLLLAGLSTKKSIRTMHSIEKGAASCGATWRTFVMHLHHYPARDSASHCTSGTLEGPPHRRLVSAVLALPLQLLEYGRVSSV